MLLFVANTKNDALSSTLLEHASAILESENRGHKESSLVSKGQGKSTGQSLERESGRESSRPCQPQETKKQERIQHTKELSQTKVDRESNTQMTKDDVKICHNQIKLKDSRPKLLSQLDEDLEEGENWLTESEEGLGSNDLEKEKQEGELNTKQMTTNLKFCEEKINFVEQNDQIDEDNGAFGEGSLQYGLQVDPVKEQKITELLNVNQDLLVKIPLNRTNSK